MGVAEEGDLGSEEFASVIERIGCSYSYAWEGEIEEVEDLEDVRIRRFPEGSRWFEGVVQRTRLDPERMHERVQELTQVTGSPPRRFCWYVQHSSPPGLDEVLA